MVEARWEWSECTRVQKQCLTEIYEAVDGDWELANRDAVREEWDAAVGHDRAKVL